jgi:hypothetical protein
VPPNYRQGQGAPLRDKEKRSLALLAGLLVAVGTGLGSWALASAGSGPAAGKCVSVVVASSTGGGELRYCGTQARRWCAATAQLSRAVAPAAEVACRRAGFLPAKPSRV